MEHYDETKKLSDRIAFHKARKTILNPHEDEELVIENCWAASHVCAAILIKTEPQENYYITPSHLETLKDKFIKETGLLIDIPKLFDKHWLRLVFGIVEVPKGIQSAAHSAARVREFFHELTFLLEMQAKNADKKCMRDELLAEAARYESANKIKIDLEAARKRNYWSDKDGVITFQNLSGSKFVLDNITDLVFIETIYQAYYFGTENTLRIPAEALISILDRYSKAFPGTPTPEEFVKQKVFTISIDKQYYAVDIQYCSMPLRQSIHNKTAALLWNKLLEDNSFGNDSERMFFWYTRIIHRESWCTLEYFPASDKAIFLETASKIVLEDADVTNGKDEYWKIKLDGMHSELYNLQYYYAKAERGIEFPTTKDLFELYEEWITHERGSNDELMVGQDTRAPLKYFITQLVRNDNEYSYEYTRLLLQTGNAKPFIFWKTCFEIFYWKPEAIPYLVQSDNFASLGISLMHNMELSENFSEEVYMLKRKLIEDTFSLIQQSLSESADVDTKRKATIIFQCLLKAGLKKFKVSGMQNIPMRQKEKKVRIQHSDKLKTLFRSAKLPGTCYGVTKYNDLFYPQLLPDLFAAVNAYSPKDVLQNATYGLAYVKLDLLAFLEGLVKDMPPVRDLENPSELRSKICSAFNREYLAAMDRREIERLDFRDGLSMMKSIPSWNNQLENESLIDWSSILLSLEEENLLDSFIAPAGLVFTDKPGPYDDYNRFIASKLRTHLSILLRAYNNLFKAKEELQAKNLPVTNVLSKLENKITLYITSYSSPDALRNRYEIFDYTLERGLWMPQQEELIPVIGNTLNHFGEENRDNIIEKLINTEPLIRSLKLLDHVVSEKDKKKLLDTIRANNIRQTLDDTYPADREFITQRLSQEPEFIHQAEEALQLTEEANNRSTGHFQNNENQIFVYRTKLLLANQKNDEKAIEGVEEPDIKHHSDERFSARDEKDFYKALVYLKKKEPEKAYEIFSSQLSYAKGERPTLALNTFASKLHWAEKEKGITKKKLYREALEEWINFEKEISNIILFENINDKIQYNKLDAANELEKDEEFDAWYNELNREMQLRLDFLELRIKNLMRRKMQQRAEELLKKAKDLHKLDTGDYPSFIHELETLITTEETIDYLKNQYSRIMSSAPEHLVQIIPDSINRANKIPDFILNCIIGSLNDMLTHINSIGQIDHEDKYSEVLMSLLDARMHNVLWHTQILSGGYADSELDNPGKIDFGILTAVNEKLAVCEALILEGKNTFEVQKHVLKIFNYDHIRKLFYVIVYYKGEQETFDDSWDKYRSTVEDFIVFPDKFPLKDKLTPVSSYLENNSLKIAKSLHGEGTELFHIFINISYRAKLTKNKIRSKKKD